ncbi:MULTISPECIES: MafI family immunity protein [Proteus]|uniref:MafI family immunity protein n=1 Tax=Proteus TaxID=583 RepID=UPI001376A290|nr:MULTISPECIES: MafI family immunity protein [Proteus]NBM89253.1 MafI family immunity protein [Proteus sp. G2658]
MTKLDIQIKNFGTLFFDRLNTELLQDAINYIEYDERGLAFETICDHISEYNIPITSEEYHIAVDLANELKMNSNDISLLHMKELIVKK